MVIFAHEQSVIFLLYSPLQPPCVCPNWEENDGIKHIDGTAPRLAAVVWSTRILSVAKITDAALGGHEYPLLLLHVSNFTPDGHHITQPHIIMPMNVQRSSFAYPKMN